ncbi:hypothetical protein AVEN_256229-1 [Araneus ventricosus]|uniref:Uncharacterized protein n=1 Tax=Araneus ventricosus TaxID=182803 RepID=A0A4Y2LQK5_ARAVE|nr:hypothetical protein AVEN_256229-1 [Araneus ventricosus]
MLFSCNQCSIVGKNVFELSNHLSSTHSTSLLALPPSGSSFSALSSSVTAPRFFFDANFGNTPPSQDLSVLDDSPINSAIIPVSGARAMKVAMPPASIPPKNCRSGNYKSFPFVSFFFSFVDGLKCTEPQCNMSSQRLF